MNTINTLSTAVLNSKLVLANATTVMNESPGTGVKREMVSGFL